MVVTAHTGRRGVEPPSGVGIGLVLGEIAALLLAFHWARIVGAEHLPSGSGRGAQARGRRTRRVGLVAKPPRSATGDEDGPH